MPTQMTSVGSAVEFKTDGEALDDVGAVACLRGLRDALDRAIGGSRVIFGDPDEEAGHAKTDQHREEQVPAGEGTGELADRGLSPDVQTGRLCRSADVGVQIAEHQLRHRIDRRHRQDRGDPEALVERAHDRTGLADPDEIGADDRGDDAHAADQQRQAHQAANLLRNASDQKRDQDHRRTDGDDIGLEQIGCHSGAIADIVADIVRDHGGVAGIVLGDTGLDLADQVGADVRGLGEDAAAETSEDRDQRSAERQGDQRVDHLAVVRCEALNVDEHVEEDGDGEQRETGDEHARDRARTERDGKAAL